MFLYYIYLAIEGWKSLGPQNLSTFNHSQRRQDPECVTLALPTHIRLCLKKGVFFSSFFSTRCVFVPS